MKKESIITLLQVADKARVAGLFEFAEMLPVLNAIQDATTYLEKLKKEEEQVSVKYPISDQA